MKIDRIIIPENAVGIDKACGTIQNILGNEFAWLDHIFGKTEILTTKKGDKTHIYPAVSNTKQQYNYIDVLPNRNLSNTSFFIIEDPQTVLDYLPNRNVRLEFKASVVFWCNLKKVYPNENTRDVERLKFEILDVLNTKIKFRDARFQVTQVAERFENIYKEYSYKEIDEQNMMHPYVAFRFYGKMQINQLCY